MSINKKQFILGSSIAICITILILCTNISAASTIPCNIDERMSVQMRDRVDNPLSKDFSISFNRNPSIKSKLNNQIISETGIDESNYSFDLHGNARLLWKYENTKVNSEIGHDWINDTDGDGISDIIAYDNYNGNGTLFLLSSSTGTVIWSQDFDREIEIAGDIGDIKDMNGDRVYNFIIYSNEYNETTNESMLSLYLINGSNGNIIWNKNSMITGRWDASKTTGTTIRNDLNEDGVNDMLIMRNSFEYDLCYLDAVSGMNGSIIWHVEMNNNFRGDNLRELPDLDGDEIGDYVTSSYSNERNIGNVIALSGKDGSTLWNQSITGYYSLWSCADIDFNEDGIVDVVVEGYNWDNSWDNNGSIFMLDGGNGDILWNRSIIGYDLWFHANFDFNNDGIVDIAVESNNWDDNTINIFILDGGNGDIIWNRYYNGSISLGFWVYDDFDDDGIYDVVVGSDTVQMLSGATGDVIWEIDLKESNVGICRDIDGDGKKDVLAITNIQIDTHNFLYNITAFNGVNGYKIWESSIIQYIDAIPPEGVYNDTFCFIHSHGWADQNGDGVPDPIINIDYSCFYWNESTLEHDDYSTLKLVVMNGSNGEEIWDAEITFTGWNWISEICTEYDLDYDGVNDMFFSTLSGMYAVNTTGIV